MKKFINAPDDVAAETVEGFLAVHRAEFTALPGALGVVRRRPRDGVAVVSGGGSGHEPVWLEYAGPGFADAVVQGDVFAAPPPPAIVAAARAVDRGHGVLFVYGNYTGDALNFDLAAEELEAAGHRVRTVRVNDDVAAAPPERAEDRRGIAGGFFISKVAGAAADAGLDLDAVHAAAALANERTRSIGVASGAGTVPGSDEPTFTLPDGTMEIGLGMHGEPGVRQGPMLSADAAVEQMLDLLAADLGLRAGDRVCVLVNGLGATTRAELWIASRRLVQLLDARQVAIHDFLVGDYATSQEMHGFSVSLLALDPALQEWYDRPGRTSFHASRPVAAAVAP
jgi:dihydroxyacetone kinase-like protein